MKTRAVGYSLLALGIFFAVAPAADAATCSFDSISGVNFGPYDVFNGSPKTTTGTIRFSCTGIKPNTRVTVDLSTGSSNTFTARTLRSGGDVLTYNLYPDVTNSQVWGDGTGGTYDYGPVHPDPSTTLTIYGTIPAGQNAGVGSNYIDNITVTMNF